jgi:hypothetical protein
MCRLAVASVHADNPEPLYLCMHQQRANKSNLMISIQFAAGRAHRLTRPATNLLVEKFTERFVHQTALAEGSHSAQNYLTTNIVCFKLDYLRTPILELSLRISRISS